MINDNLLKELETEIAELLVDKLEHQNINLERASAIARLVLTKLPEGTTDEQVKKIIPSLDDEFFELSEIVYRHMVEYEEKYKPFILEEVRELMKHKHFDEANELLEKYYHKSLN